MPKYGLTHWARALWPRRRRRLKRPRRRQTLERQHHAAAAVRGAVTHVPVGTDVVDAGPQCHEAGVAGGGHQVGVGRGDGDAAGARVLDAVAKSLQIQNGINLNNYG